MACLPYATENCAYIVRVRNMVGQSQPECLVSRKLCTDKVERQK